VRDPRQLHPRLVTGRLDAEPGKNPCDRPCEHYWDRQPQGSTKQRRVNLSGDDDIRNQRERGGNQHGPLAWVVGIGDCDLIHAVEVTGGCGGSLSIPTGQLGWLSQGRRTAAGADETQSQVLGGSIGDRVRTGPVQLRLVGRDRPFKVGRFDRTFKPDLAQRLMEPSGFS
jgi:hypothetical protein